MDSKWALVAISQGFILDLSYGRNGCRQIAEQRHQPVAELFCHMAAHLRHRRRRVVEISVHEVTLLLGIEPSRNAGRVH